MEKFLKQGVLLFLLLQALPLFSQTVEVANPQYLMDGANPNFVWARQISDNKLTLGLTDDFLEFLNDEIVFHGRGKSNVIAHYLIEQNTDEVIFYRQDHHHKIDTIGKYLPINQLIFVKNDPHVKAVINFSNEMVDLNHKVILKVGRVNKMHAAFFSLYFMFSNKNNN